MLIDFIYPYIQGYPTGTFGVPLEVLIERCGVDSVLGYGPGRIKIPSFLDESITAMKTMGMFGVHFTIM